MLSIRPALRRSYLAASSVGHVASVNPNKLSSKCVIARGLSTSDDKKDVKALSPMEEARQELENEKSLVQRKVEAMHKYDPHMIFGVPDDGPDPVLPDNPAEITALDAAHLRQHANSSSGDKRVVHIRQGMHKVTQNPITEENKWIISFADEGEFSETWDNPLMGWVSGADPMSSTLQEQFTFDTASEAVYFAKKRGWQFIVAEPIFRKGRSDGARYQDCFLPQNVAAKVKRDGILCNHWERTQAGTSHYDRPLKYHGDGVVRQHGPNMEQAPEPHVQGYYKMR